MTDVRLSAISVFAAINWPEKSELNSLVYASVALDASQSVNLPLEQHCLN